MNQVRAAVPARCNRRRPDWEGAIAYALARLDGELSPRLYYHSLRHTRDDVLPAVERLAALEGVTGQPLLLLRVAAAFHDLGFVEQYAEHEGAGIRIAAATLPHFGFARCQRRLIAGMIRATRLPQAPTNLLEAILADADLDSLGRDDFFATSLALRAELAERDHLIDEATWFARQLRLLQSHHYSTRSARGLRDAQTARNAEVVATLVAVRPPRRG